MDKGWSSGEYVECLVVEGRSLVVVFRIRLLSSCAPVEHQRAGASMLNILQEILLLEVKHSTLHIF